MSDDAGFGGRLVRAGGEGGRQEICVDRLAPAPGEVRIKTEAFGINRLDQMMRAGFSPRPIRLPHARLGVEGTGTI
ncbi:MAG TPA: hypothetical protein VGI96_50725, partial [Streptosporangiaceae bacterium]